MPSHAEVLEANFAAREPSFAYAFHEQDRFEEPLFWDLYNALVALGTGTAGIAVDARLSRELVHLFGYLLGCLIWHVSPDDLAHIDGLEDPDRLRAVVERLKAAFHCPFGGGIAREDQWCDGLSNPAPTWDPSGS